MTLKNRIEKIKENIKNNSFLNESSVSQGAVLPVLAELGWDVYNPAMVTPEYTVEGRRVDFALCNPENKKPLVFIEVKALGKAEGAEKQLFEYAFHKGIPFVILTTGQEWSFFLTLETGHYSERRIYKLDLMTRDINECCEKLERYLSFEDVKSEESIDKAREDLKNQKKNDNIKQNIPKAWNLLLKEGNLSLISILSDKVEEMTGSQPSIDMIRTFLQNQNEPLNVNPPSASQKNNLVNNCQSSSTTVENSQNSQKDYYRPSIQKTALKETKQRTKKILILNGKKYDCGNTARRLLITAFDLLLEQYPEKILDLAGVFETNSRCLLAEKPEKLYKTSTHLVAGNFVELKNKWFIGTNLSENTIKEHIRKACQILGVTVNFEEN